MRWNIAAGVVALALGLQGAVGALSGKVVFVDGSPAPGVTVGVVVGETRRTAVTDVDGAYRIDGVPPGEYRVEANLSLCRPSVADAVLVQPRAVTARDFTLRGCIIVDVDREYRGLVTSLEASAAVLRIRVTETLGPALVGQAVNLRSVEHAATVLDVLKSDDAQLRAGGEVRFFQVEAGEWTDAGRRFVGRQAPYRVGDEFVGVFRREQGGRLVEYLGASLMVRLVDGRIEWRLDPTSGISDGMPADDFIEALRRLLAS